jgi:hypothetical protein
LFAASRCWCGAYTRRWDGAVDVNAQDVDAALIADAHLLQRHGGILHAGKERWRTNDDLLQLLLVLEAPKLGVMPIFATANATDQE